MKKQCRMCESKKFKKVIDFGKNPLVNSLIEKEDLGKKEKTYPLVVEQCQKCGLVQIVNPISGEQIYKEQDYLYLSGDMPQLSEYFKEYADDSYKSYLDQTDLVVEIGSNDGILLKHYKDKGCKVLGVDPASNVVLRALADEIPTLSDFFTERVAKSIVKYWGKAKIVCGNNCIAHLANLKDLTNGVKTLLEDDGVFIVECNYWGGMVKNKNYSLIYHDHFSYFSLKNWVDFLDKYDMEVFDAMVTPAQGGSLRLFAGFKKKHIKTQRFLDLLQEELDTNLGSYETCQRYEKECRAEAKKLKTLIQGLKKDGKTIAGYGAAAKGFSVLKLAGIDERHIDYFVDDSPAKQGKFTPISHIPVISRKDVYKYTSGKETKNPDYFFITAPNYEAIIIEKEQDFAGKFITVDSRII